MRVTTDPLETFNLFARAYRDLRPTQLVSRGTYLTTSEIIDDILCAREIHAFKQDVSFGSLARSDDQEDIPCSRPFLGFVSQLESAMVEQQNFLVQPERAIELLYNFDITMGWSQPILVLSGSQRRAVFSSTPTFDVLMGVHIALPMFGLQDPYDWTID